MGAASGYLQGRCRVEPVSVHPRVEDVIRKFSARKSPTILESSLDVAGGGRFSFFAADPVRVVEATIPDERAFRGLFDELGQIRAEGAHQGVPFCGGWIGYLGYECGLGLERVPRVGSDAWPLPDARFALYDTVAVFDHHSEQWLIAGIDWAGDMLPRRAPLHDRFADTLATLRAATAQGSTVESRPDKHGPGGCGLKPVLTAGMSPDQYHSKIERIKRYIEAGDAYQVNLTQRWSAKTSATPLQHYLRLREISPSPYAAFLSWDDITVISASPELFLEVRGRNVMTRPIKGTRPRTGDGPRDEAARRDLEESEKDVAELNMIVDVLRNDLGRVCEYGSVRVVSSGEVEEHPTVFHRVATIEGTLRADSSAADLLGASFPGGSVTGAPKIRAMQIISELERFPRGVYCGCIGWIGLDGSMTLNLAIRTMVQIGGEVFAYAGGGIVHESDPQAEYDETETKLAAMKRSLGAE